MVYLDEQDAQNSDKIKKLAEQALQTPVSDIRPFAGAISYNYRVNHNTVFKVASSRTNLRDWEKVARNATVLQNPLSVEIPLPRLHTLYNTSTKTSVAALSYPLVAGKTISGPEFTTQSSTFKKKFFEQLTEKMHELHQIPPSILPIKPQTVFEQVAQGLFTKDKTQHYVAKGAKALFMNHASAATLLHLDLHAQNVCIDNEKIVGLLDFDSCCIGSPVFEFRPKLYDADTEQLMNCYHTKYPTDFSPKEAQDFMRKYHVLFQLFCFANTLKPKNAKRTPFEQVLQAYQLKEKNTHSKQL